MNKIMTKVLLRTLFLCGSLLFLQNFNTLSHPGGKGTYKIKKVVLDAGHGGKDPGCVGAISYEKNNVLSIVLRLGEFIEANYPDVEVIYTRKTDVFIELKERAAIANRNNADLFISVHCNALTVPTAKGAETYVMGLHTARHNLEVAKRENASIYMEDDYKKNYGDYDPDSPEAHILGSMWQSAYLEQSILLAGFMQKHAKAVAGREDRGVKQAGFLVLKETAMPSVLVEAGYLTNAEEEMYLASEEGQYQVAEAIFSAFRDYKNRMEGRSDIASSKNSEGSSAKGNTVKNIPPKTTKIATTTQKTDNQSVSKTKAAYRILLLTHSAPMDTNSGLLSLLENIKEEKQNGKYQYFTGNFASRSEAEKMLPEYKNLGFGTAVVVETNSK
jgi:N-acetylmuramoyl-L-alanine amidase